MNLERGYYNCSFTMDIDLSPGTYTILCVADAGEGCLESNEANNVSVYTLHVTK
ncbi:hypothetical protein J7K97_00570 [Candidatus Aerophobetes bacterium]|nr:hypothetical protein [Candidatus Aerophobetes bacterium]